MPAPTLRIYIDKTWVPCSAADEYGALGIRNLCVLGGNPGQPIKKLLIRYNTWPQSGGRPGENLLSLTVSKVPAGKGYGQRPVAGKKYHIAAVPDAVPGNSTAYHVFQQDVTDLTPLGRAVRHAFEQDKPQYVWKLFHSCCKALQEFGDAAGATVPLQCPASLAVETRGRIVLLDAGVRPADALPAAGEARQLYETWFGRLGASATAPAAQASVLHADALLRYFRQLLAALRPELAGSAAKVCDDFRQRLDQPMVGALGDLDAWVRGQSEDWNLYVEDEGFPVAVGHAESPPLMVTVPRGRKRRSLQLRLSLLLNLLLAIAVVVFLLLWRKGAGAARGKADADGSSPSARGNADTDGGSSLVFSSYCVVTPVQGTIGEKVGAALEELFPGKSFAVSPDVAEHDKRLREKLAEAVKSLGDAARHRQLLTRLGKDHGVHFKGFMPGEPADGLPSVVERGAIFTLAGEHQRHGSLLQSNGLQKVLAQAGMEGDRGARDLLMGLKTATAEYASLKDALSVIRDQTAYVLRVEPTARAHEQARAKLLSRLDRPVFISRPVLELYDAVDPTADMGGGSAAYSLRLDRRCFWRQASRESRRDIDYRKNASNAKIRWQEFAPGRLISWKPVPLTRRSGRTEAVSSFDIAVVLPEKGRVVVFRNLSILVGDSRNQVLTQGQDYVTKALRLRVAPGEDIVSARKLGDQWTGALMYSSLASQVKETHAGEDKDIQLLTPGEFDKVRAEDDSF